MQERYAICFSSKTGNTEALAKVVQETLPEESCAYYGSVDQAPDNAEIYYVGFWTDKGTADAASLAFLKTLHEKQIFLFGTAGFGGSEAYFQKILDQVKESIDSSNTVIDQFMCQGRMPQSVRDRYVKMRDANNTQLNWDAMIQNFDQACAHPNSDDFAQLKQMLTKK